MKAKRLIPCCYLAAAVLWLVMGVVGMIGQLRSASGNLSLTATDFVCTSFVAYADLDWHQPPYDEEDPDWYLSTDNDAQMLWTPDSPRYVSRVILRAIQYYPPGTVMLYYLKPGQTDFRETQKVLARSTGKGEYTFDLGGIRVSGLRIDPDSRGGVPTLLRGVELVTLPWYAHFIPNGGQWMLLLFGPLVLAAALSLGAELFRKGGR